MKNNLISVLSVCGLLMLSACGGGDSSPSTPSRFTVGGMVSGLKGAGLVLQNNNSDVLAVTANGAFTFATPLNAGAIYKVSVKTQPSGSNQTCTVSNGDGTISNANVNNISVICAILKTPRFAYALRGRAWATTPGEIIAYNVDPATGAFTRIGAFNSGIHTHHVTADPSGRFLYASESTAPGSGSPQGKINVYSINQGNGHLTKVGELITQHTVLDLQFDPTGRFAYSLGMIGGDNDNVASVSTFSVNPANGSLTSVGLISEGTDPSGFTIDSNGKYLYVIRSKKKEIVTYNINSTTGALINTGNILLTPDAHGIVAESTGRFVFSDALSKIFSYAVDSRGGNLTRLDTLYETNFFIRAIALDPSGRFLYTNGGGDTAITSFVIDSFTGRLTNSGTAGQAGGSFDPIGLKVDPSGKFVYRYARDDTSGFYGFTINQTTGALENGRRISDVNSESMVIVGY